MTCQRVLLIDDEANVLKALERVFRREPLDLVTTSNPAEALTLVAECETAVIVSDQRMPQMPGTHLLEKLRQIAPDAIRMTLTGYADKDAAIEAINRGAVHRFLTKPWDDQQLKQEILHAVEEYNLKSEVKRLQAVTLEQNRQLQEWNSQLEVKVEQRTAEITQLNRELRTSLMTSIAVMSRLGEIHSPTIGSHSQRVATLARDLAIDLQLDASTINATYAAALLHDIGKMGLPRELLEKNPGFFNESEKELYRGHVLEGERIIALVPAIHPAAQLVRSHHERWDGTGYPDELAGEAIPYGARLIAVADAYDNFIHSKVNFGTISATRALEQIIQASGIWFDPAASGR